jgi:hypothetical protein
MGKNHQINLHHLLVAIISALVLNLNIYAQNQGNAVTVNWSDIVMVSRTTPTLQLVENPKVRPSSPIHEKVFSALKNLGAADVRYVPWFPYPKMAVAELKPPTKDKTFWDFSYLDSTMNAFMKATKGYPVVINFSTTPAWMWKTEKEVAYPENPYQTCWDYNQGKELRDTTVKELSGYFARLFSWYTKGGFTDELGKFHKSDHFYRIAYWEVLNEPDGEHQISPQMYTRIYDAIVSELKKISPDTMFVGLALAGENNPEYFEYFLNPKNHKQGIPLEGISYHHYSSPSIPGQPLEWYQYTFFEKADCFLDKVRYIENIRKRLAPGTFTMVNEIGVILQDLADPSIITSEYWNVAGTMYAHIFLELTRLGINVAGESQLVGYPSQYPDVSMVNWETGNPNARYWVLKLLIDNFRPGDQLVDTHLNTQGVDAQGIITKTGEKILLINKRNVEVELRLPSSGNNYKIRYVDVETGENPPAKAELKSEIIKLKPFSVIVVDL